MSIELQLVELRELAKDEHIEIVREFVEKQSAKAPGRPVFNEMLKRINKGEAKGIVCQYIHPPNNSPYTDLLRKRDKRPAAVALSPAC